MTVSAADAEVPFFIPPKRLPEDEIPVGAIQIDVDDAISCARFALAHLQHSQKGFPKQFFPKPELYRCAVLGAYDVHDKNFLYYNDTSLKDLIERKINTAHSQKYIIPVLTSDDYYCFELAEFHYPILDELKDKTFAIDFILVLPGIRAGYVFFEDDPVCYMFFESQEEFGKGFLSPEEARAIFADHMTEWKSYESEATDAWLRRVRDALQSNEIASDE